jgi:hypothetical protein
VILDDDSLTLHKVAHQSVRTYMEPLTLLPDQNLLVKSVIKAKDDKFLLLLLLKACAEIKLQIDDKNQDYQLFYKILVEISQQCKTFDEDKSQYEWEKQLTLSWEKLIESREYKN